MKSKEMKMEKVLEQFHYFNIQEDVDSIFGDWAVSSNGDVVNTLYPYAIFAIHFDDADWIAEVKKKVWFEAEFENTLGRALKRAHEILKSNNSSKIP